MSFISLCWINLLQIGSYWWFDKRSRWTRKTQPLPKFAIISIRNSFYLGSRNRSSNSMDTLVHEDPNPSPPPNPAMTLRAPLPPPRASTTPANPPITRPATVETIMSSKPFVMIADTLSSEGIVGDTAGDDELSLMAVFKRETGRQQEKSSWLSSEKPEKEVLQLKSEQTWEWIRKGAAPPLLCTQSLDLRTNHCNDVETYE